MLIKPKKVRELLDISNNTLIKLRRQNQLKYKKIGSHYRYTQKSVEDYENNIDNYKIEMKGKIKTKLSNRSVKLNSYWT